jgi:CRP-like cAMP-binding protein
MSEPPDPAFLRASDLFEHQSEEVLRAVLAQGRIEAFGAGQVVFRQGEAGDRLYIVKSGVLEVLASRDGAEAVPVAYLGEGEVLGELALLTGSPRSATARAPERAEVLTLEKPVFLDLMATLPRFSQDLCAVLARRLEATTLKVPRATSAKQLQGNLKFFDLATVIQTLIGAQQTGTLLVTQEGGQQRVAELFFFKGNVAKAKVRHLSGDDAVFQLFQAPIEGEFSFTGRTVQEEDVHSDITMPAISLLMESVRLQDELPLLKQRIPDLARIFRQKAAELAWTDAENVELAAAVWSRLRKGASVAELQKDVARCSYAIYRTLVTMLDAGQIE